MPIKLRSPFFVTKSQETFPFTPTGLGATTLSKIATILGGGYNYDYNTQTAEGQAKAYATNSILQSIIDKKIGYAQAGTIVIKKGDKEFSTGAEYSKLNALLQSPNPFQSWNEFEAAIIMYIHVYGFAPIYKVYPPNRNTGLPIALWVINPETFNYELTGKQYSQISIKGIVKYVEFQNYNGNKTRLEGDYIDNLWVINGRTMRTNKTSPSDMYTALSPLYSLKDELSLFNTGFNIYATLLKQSILGIISNRTKDQIGYVQLDDKTKDELNSTLRDKYGVVEGKNNFVISNRDVFFQSLLTNIGNLQIPEGVRMATYEICNKLNFQVELLANKDVKFENKKSAEIIQYQDDIVPMMSNVYQSISSFISKDNISIYRYYGDLSIMQENEKERADVLRTNVESGRVLYEAGLITENQYLEMCGLDAKINGDKHFNQQ